MSKATKKDNNPPTIQKFRQSPLSRSIKNCEYATENPEIRPPSKTVGNLSLIPITPHNMGIKNNEIKVTTKMIKELRYPNIGMS